MTAETRGKIIAQGSSQARLVTKSQKSVLDPNPICYHVVVPAINIASHKLHDHGVGYVHHQMSRRPKRHWPNAIMRSNGEIISIRQRRNFAGLSQTAAPGHVGN